MKLIDKDALVAEIEKLYNGEIDTYTRSILDRLKSNLNALEVKEVDLEKEIEKYAYSLPHSVTGTTSYVSDVKAPIAREFGVKHAWSYEDVEQIAEHFYELGLKLAQKE